MSGTRAYAGHEIFVAPARAHAEIWRFVMGMVLAVIAYFVFNQMFFQLIFTLAGPVAGAALMDDLPTGTTPLSMYVLLASFGCMVAGVALSARLLHKRGWLTLLGPLPLWWQDFRATLIGVALVMGAMFVLPPWDMGGEFVQNMPLPRWLLLLAPSLLFIFIQTSAEEIVFRGYVQQQLAARFSSPMVWMVLPSVLFALGHYLPESAGENALPIALWAGVFGVLMADLTARSGTLGPAMAVHFLNNVSAILIISLPEELSGLALYLTPFSMEDADALQEWLLVDFAVMFVLWLAARVAIRR